MRFLQLVSLNKLNTSPILTDRRHTLSGVEVFHVDFLNNFKLKFKKILKTAQDG